jgi:hypothetical protein
MTPKKLYLYHSTPRNFKDGVAEFVYVSGRKIKLNQDGTVSQNSVWYSAILEIERVRKYRLKIPRVGCLGETVVPLEIWNKIKNEGKL